MNNLHELERAQEALRAGNYALCGRYLENALERVRCMYCHGRLGSPDSYRPHFKGYVHLKCAREYNGRMDYMNKHGIS